MPWRIAREGHGLHEWLRQGKYRRRGRLRAPHWMQKIRGLLREAGIERRGFQEWRCGVGGGLGAWYGCGLFAKLRKGMGGKGGKCGVSVTVCVGGFFYFVSKDNGAIQEGKKGAERESGLSYGIFSVFFQSIKVLPVFKELCTKTLYSFPGFFLFGGDQFPFGQFGVVVYGSRKGSERGGDLAYDRKMCMVGISRQFWVQASGSGCEHLVYHTLKRRRRRGRSLGEGIEVAAHRGRLFKGRIEERILSKFRGSEKRQLWGRWCTDHCKKEKRALAAFSKSMYVASQQ